MSFFFMSSVSWHFSWGNLCKSRLHIYIGFWPFFWQGCGQWSLKMLLQNLEIQEEKHIFENRGWKMAGQVKGSCGLLEGQSSLPTFKLATSLASNSSFWPPWHLHSHAHTQIINNQISDFHMNGWGDFFFHLLLWGFSRIKKFEWILSPTFRYLYTQA